MIDEEPLRDDEIKKKQEKLFEQQKKFRNLETDKKYFAEESINFIKKQKVIIDKLKRECQTLKDVMSKVENAKENQTKTSQGFYPAEKEKISEIMSEIQQEKEMQKNIDIHIANFQKKIVEKKKNNVGSISGAENETNLHKQIKILENRLDKANQKYNETIAINKELKGNIDSLRKQRIIFDNLYKKLENQLNEKKKIMAEIIEKANSSYEERDKANTKIQTLKDIAKKQASEFEKEIKDISTSIEKVKMSAFVKKNTRAKDTYSTIGQYFHEDDAASERVVRPSKTSSQRLEKIQKYRDDIAKIEAATSITNFDELLNIFAYNEEENFKSFKYMNEQSKEIEELEFEINQIKADMQNHTQSQNSIAKDAYLEAQELQIQQKKSNLAELEETELRMKKEAEGMTIIMERIVETIQTDRDLASQLCGSKQINQNNLGVFLTIIEEKATHVVNTYKNLSPNSYERGATKPTLQQTNVLTFQDFEDHEEYDKLLTVEQLKRKASNFLNREQNLKTKKKDSKIKKK